MTTIYNSVAARRREIAILRALGATRARILALICFEASLIGVLGGISGFIVGHLLSAIGSVYLREKFLFGSDFPVITPERWLRDFEGLDFADEVRPLILRDNAARVLRLG